jgi:hypothetical protein
MKNIFAVLLLILMGCSHSVTVNSTKSENILGLSLNYEQKQINITVVSNGCTTKEDFTLQMQQNSLLISRKKKDVCKAMPEPVQFTWSFKEAGIDDNIPFSVQNRFSPNIFTATISSPDK